MSLSPHVHDAIHRMVHAYGYRAVGGLIALESMGLPLPGETALVGAAIYAATTHRLDISVVVLVAALGGILGNTAGYGIGRAVGYRLLRRFGPYVWLTPERLHLGRCLMRRHGGKVVFAGRFVALLRCLAGLLAGALRLDWWRFCLANVAGTVLWVCLYGFGAYALGKQIHAIAGPVGIAIGVLVTIGLIALIVFMRRNEARLIDWAHRELAD